MTFTFRSHQPSPATRPHAVAGNAANNPAEPGKRANTVGRKSERRKRIKDEKRTARMAGEGPTSNEKPFNLDLATEDTQRVSSQLICEHIQAMKEDGHSHRGLWLARLDLRKLIKSAAKQKGISAQELAEMKVIAKFCPECEPDFPNDSLVWCMPYSILDDEDLKKEMLTPGRTLEPASKRGHEAEQRILEDFATTGLIN